MLYEQDGAKCHYEAVKSQVDCIQLKEVIHFGIIFILGSIKEPVLNVCMCMALGMTSQ